MMANITTNKGTFWGYETDLQVINSDGTYTFTTKKPRGYGLTIEFEIPFNTDGSIQHFTVTLYNISEKHAAVLKKGNHVKVTAGPTDLFSKITEGTIISSEEDPDDNLDYPIKLNCLGGVDYSKTKNIYSTAFGSKSSKHAVTIKKGEVIKWNTSKRLKVKLTFKKGTKPSTIMKRIIRQAKMTVKIKHLKTDKPIKKAYTLSAKPFNALQSLAKKCGSKLYFTRDGWVIDDFDKPDIYKDHIYLTSNELSSEPTQDESDDGKVTYSFTTALDPRIDAGTIIDLNSRTLDGFVRVLSGEHDSADWTTQCEVEKIG
ncbi:hypothetical protein [Secundilactobacillus pentosiphilus]|nr:hypothetical protein [Secundilactobacillus pentosiphilus]